jgi:hypothetical protein
MLELSVVCYEEWIRMVMADWNDYDGKFRTENDIRKLYEEYVIAIKKKK